MELRSAAESDLPLLAEMNLRPVQDQGGATVIRVADFRSRMAAWLSTAEWRIGVFAAAGAVAGCAVHQRRRHRYFLRRQVGYLRQFLIDRPHRRRGLGTAALSLFRAHRCPEGAVIEIGALPSNPAGQHFWHANGLREFCVTLHAASAECARRTSGSRRSGCGRRGSA